ncbi:hypothetical protein DIPPA_10958, partial [Diplonema papillatum]
MAEAITEPVDKGVEKMNQASGGVLSGQMDWGSKGGKCYEFWNCSPCCGGYCCVTWWCCGCLNAPRMFAWSLDQDCACINHWVVANCLPACCCIRYSIRQKLQIPGGGPMQGLLGDCLCASWYAPPCFSICRLAGGYGVFFYKHLLCRKYWVEVSGIQYYLSSVGVCRGFHGLPHSRAASFSREVQCGTLLKPG